MTVDAWTPNWIALDGAVNARAVVPGVLLRSDNLQGLTQRDVRLLVEQHALEVVVDLRTGYEVTREGPGLMVGERAVRIEHRSLIPESGNTDLDEAIVPQFPPEADQWPDESPLVRAYLSYLQRRPDSIVGATRAIARSDRAVLVHCAAGKDRTGVVVALALDAAGIDRAMILDDYLATAERIEAIIARLLGSPTYRSEVERDTPRSLAPVPETLERLFEFVDRCFGGSVAWLSAHGLDRIDLERLRRRLAPAAAASAGG